jgi:hypothetical protein
VVFQALILRCLESWFRPAGSLDGMEFGEWRLEIRGWEIEGVERRNLHSWPFEEFVVRNGFGFPTTNGHEDSRMREEEGTGAGHSRFPGIPRVDWTVRMRPRR